MIKELLNTENARKLLEMSRSSFFRLQKANRIEASAQINGRNYYTLQDLANAVEKPRKK